MAGKKIEANGLDDYLSDIPIFFGMTKLFDCKAKSVDDLDYVSVLVNLLKANSLNMI